MRRKTYYSLATLGMLIMLVTLLARGQSAPRIEVSIPFGFTAGSTKLPAGDYRLIFNQPADGALAVQNVRTKDRALVFPVATETHIRQEKARLVFNRYGEKFFLSQVFTPGQTRGVALLRSEEETQLARTTRQRETASLTGKMR
ncbi:MAG: hypothetical protein HY650_14650 [Acidobacteria bacterium]|nr:hypothetical protein [Acidobacteriota bacterium]